MFNGFKAYLHYLCTLTNPTDQPFYSDAVCIVVTLYHNNYYYWIKDSDNSY